MSERPGIDMDKTKIIFVIALSLTFISVLAAIFLPGGVLVYGAGGDPPLVPPFVVLFSLIGGLMYFFASTVSEWIDIREALKKNGSEDELDEFSNRPFFDKLKEFDLERKILRLIAAPPMAIGIYLLFDLIFFDLNIATEQQASNASLMNSTMQDLVREIEAADNTEKLISIKAGISFLVGAFVKQFLGLIRSFVSKIGNS